MPTRQRSGRQARILLALDLGDHVEDRLGRAPGQGEGLEAVVAPDADGERAPSAGATVSSRRAACGTGAFMAQRSAFVAAPGKNSSPPWSAALALTRPARFM